MTGFDAQLAGMLSGSTSLVAAVVAAVGNIGRDEVFLSLLGAAAGWLRFRLAPGGHLTLSPIVFFVAILIVEPASAVIVALVSTLLASIAFGKQELVETLQETGQEGVSALAAVAAFTKLSPSGGLEGLAGMLLPYAIATAVYIAAKLTIGMVRARLNEGIALRSYLTGASKNTVANLLLLALVALGIRVSLYGRFGYFALVLATIALLELYHPWKLLTEQDEILYSNLAMVAQAIDAKDPYTARHSRNVAAIAVKIARGMQLPEEEVRKIRVGALMHDIGKIGVSGSIIRKPSKLEPDEARVMREHPNMSADIMQPIELLADAAEIVRHHHEYLDGTGYPLGLKGDEIPVGSRVILVADAFDAMTTDRPYRRGRSKEEALTVLNEYAGRQFDRDAVRALESVLHLS